MYNTEVLSQDHLSPSVPTVELCSLLSEIISISEIKSVSVKIPDNFASSSKAKTDFNPNWFIVSKATFKGAFSQVVGTVVII